MQAKSAQSKHSSRRWKQTALAIAISGAMPMLAPSYAVAQDGALALEEVVVTGIRGSLKRSLDVKRDSNQIVDAISAEDVGKFPDANVAESLQRITGVAIDRTGGEGQFITVRGLGPEFNTVLLNGRTLATDNDGREFSFDVLSSDIIQRAEVFKSAVPNLQAGGIGATVNIVTARPLAAGAQSGVNFSVAGIYDDLRGDTSPDLSATGTWVNDEGTFGIVGGISYSDRASQIDRVFTNGFSERSGATAVFAPASASGLTAANVGSLPAGSRVQQQVVVERDIRDIERTTLNGALQFRPSDRVEIVVDALYTEYDRTSFASQFSGFFSPPFINPQIDGNGTVTAFNRPGVDFQNRNPAIAGTIGLSQNDNVITADNREAESYLVGANIKYDISDAFSLNFDLSSSNATRDGTNPFVVLGALAPVSPLISNPGDSEISTLTNIVGAQDTSIQRLHFVNVARTEIDDQIDEIKVGGDWAVERGSLVNLSFGAAISDRTKERQQFDNFSPTQGGGIFCAYCGYTVDFDDSILSPISLNGFLSGVSGSDRIPVNFLNSTFEQAFAQLNSDAAINDPARTGSLSAAELTARRNAAGDSIFGFYDPAINPAGGFIVDEEVSSFFVNSEWEGELGGGVPWSANLGFRVARTETRSIGVDQPVLEIRESAGDTQLVFAFGPPTTVAITNSYTNFLPSANIRFDVAEDKTIRFAYSETVTRPTLTALGVNNTFAGRSNAPTSTGGNPDLEAFESSNFDATFEWYIDDITFVGVSAFYKDFDNFLEAQTLPVEREIVIPAGNVSNPGATDQVVTVNFQDTRTRNGETGSLTGLELALQKGWDNGLGASLNYTYVTSDIDRAMGSGASDCDYNGLSPNVLNLSGYYESDVWSARISYNYRDEFLVQCFDVQGEPREREDFAQVDFSASYNINDTYQVFFEGVNIFDEERRDFSRFENRVLEYEDTGPRYTLGLRGSF